MCSLEPADSPKMLLSSMTCFLLKSWIKLSWMLKLAQYCNRVTGFRESEEMANRNATTSLLSSLPSFHIFTDDFLSLVSQDIITKVIM